MSLGGSQTPVTPADDGCLEQPQESQALSLSFPREPDAVIWILLNQGVHLRLFPGVAGRAVSVTGSSRFSEMQANFFCNHVSALNRQGIQEPPEKWQPRGRLSV